MERCNVINSNLSGYQAIPPYEIVMHILNCPRVILRGERWKIRYV